MKTDFNLGLRPYFNSIYLEIDTKVSKEVCLNMLEHIITLYVKVWTFSFSKGVREKYRAALEMTLHN